MAPLVTNRLRTMLSLLGVVIGIFMMLPRFSRCPTPRGKHQAGHLQLGPQRCALRGKNAGTFSSDYPWWKCASKDSTLEDAELLSGRLPSARSVAFQTGNMGTLERGSSSFTGARIAAVTLEYLDAIELDIEEGRSSPPGKCRQAHPRSSSAGGIIERLFPGEDPLGQSCGWRGGKLRVIGVLAQEGTSLVERGRTTSSSCRSRLPVSS